MFTILLFLQFFLIICLTFVILMQKTSSDGLSGLAGGGHNIVSSKTSGDILVKATMILAILFMINSLTLAKIVVSDSKRSKLVFESVINPEKIPEPEEQAEVPLTN